MRRNGSSTTNSAYPERRRGPRPGKADILVGLTCVALLTTGIVLLTWWLLVRLFNPWAPPWNADPREAAAWKVLKPWAEHFVWNDEGRIVTADISGITITPKVLAAITALTDLEELSLFGAYLTTDEDLRALTKLKKLRSLSVAHTNTTDKGVAYLMQIPSLVLIDLQDTQVTDKGLDILASNSNLKYVILYGCKNITVEGVRRLKAALGPDAMVSSDFSRQQLEPAESENPPPP